VPRFDRYLLSQLLAVFGFFSLVMVAVYWVNRAVRLFDQLIGDGQSALVFVEFSLLTLPNVIRLVLPLSAFAASVYVANRLTQESELVVMQATGFSPWRMARPVLWFGLSVALMMAVLMHVLVPLSRSALAERTAEIQQNASSQFLTEGTFTHPSKGLTLYIREIAPTGELLDLFLADERVAGRSVVYTARKALFARTETGPKLLMFDGAAQEISGPARQMRLTRFADFTYDFAGLMNTAGRSTRTIDEIGTLDLLRADPALLAETGETVAAFHYDGHNRFAQPLLSVGAALIGFSALLIGAFSRFGLWRQIGLAVAFLLVVQAVSTVSTGLALQSATSWPWTYAGPLVGLAAAAGLLWFAARPRRVPQGAAEGAA
jgi:lipopolysaccharide export system permease protein